MDYTDGLTSEDAVRAVGNRFDLVLIASRRVRELNSGYTSTLNTGRGTTLTALHEIEKGLVGRDYLLKPTEINARQRRQK